MADESIVLKGVVPWGIHKLPRFVKDELESRPKKYARDDKASGIGNNIPRSSIRSAWSRICSNANANNGMDGFVFFGPNHGVDFNDQFGFNKTGAQTIGYDVNGKLHTLNAKTFPHRPPPGIDSIDTEFYGAGSSFPGLCRKTTIKWKCFSVEQLEYLTPYLMGLKVSMVIEWGWSDYHNSSLVSLDNKSQLLDFFRFPAVMDKTSPTILQRIERSNGNYDCHVGRISEYGYTMNSQGNYEGFTVVVSPTSLFEGNSMVNQANETREKNVASTFKEFVKKDFDTLASQFYPTTYDICDSSQSSATGDDDTLSPAFASFLKRSKNAKTFRLFKFADSDKLNKDGKPSAKFWINLRLFEAIFNWYGTIKVDPEKDADALFTLDIGNVIISGQPLLKAVSGDKPANLSVIIPNKFAPRMMRIFSSDVNNSFKATTGTSGKLSNIAQPNKEYEGVAKNLKSLLGKQGLVDDYDDLAEATNAVNSFPMFTSDDVMIVNPKPKDRERTSAPGYWGYLGDIYVSNELIKRAVEANDTFLRMIESMLSEISIAGSNIWEFKVIESGARITVSDMLYSPVYDPSQASDLVRFVIGQTEGSAFSEYSMNIKMSQEVALNAMLGPKSSVDPKRADMFVQEDRLYNIDGSYTLVNEKIEELTPDQKKQKEKDDKAASDAAMKKLNDRATEDGFVVWHHPNGKNYYFTERDSDFMQRIIQIKPKDAPAVTPSFPGTEFTFTMPGIAGFYFLGLFSLDGVPAPYKYDRAVFQVSGVQNSISGNNWKTTVTALVRPLTITK